MNISANIKNAGHAFFGNVYVTVEISCFSQEASCLDAKRISVSNAESPGFDTPDCTISITELNSGATTQKLPGMICMAARV